MLEHRGEYHLASPKFGERQLTHMDLHTDFSVIVCTRDRSERLKRLLASLRTLDLPQGRTWEVIVVDNGSSDATAKVLAEERALGSLPLVCVFEPVAGKSRALNRALAQREG